jgi:hypothetical protein
MCFQNWRGEANGKHWWRGISSMVSLKPSWTIDKFRARVMGTSNLACARLGNNTITRLYSDPEVVGLGSDEVAVS